MDRSISPAAAELLDFIASFETGKGPNGYIIIFGNHQGTIGKTITSMTLDELISNQRIWGRLWGSSAAGRYQFMPTTLQSLKPELKLSGNEIFSPDLQDRLAMRLLRRRFFDLFVSHAISKEKFALALAQEWASLPVLTQTQGAKMTVARGQSFYAGVLNNKALVAPERVEAILDDVLRLATSAPIASDKEISAVASTPLSTQSTTTTVPTSTQFGAKPWYLSKGVIGGLIAIALPILSLFFPAARVFNASDVTDWIMKLMEIAGPVIGGIIAIVGRVKAVGPISGTNSANLFANAGLGAGGGAATVPPATGSLLDLPLNSIAAELPQLLLTLQNAGQVMGKAFGQPPQEPHPK